MAIPSWLRSRSWRTYSFRITLLYFALLGASVLILFGVIYWVTADFMRNQLRAAIKADEFYLTDAFAVGGVDGLAAEIARRGGTPGRTPNYYLLEDPTGKRIAGNLEPRAAVTGWQEVPIPPHLDSDEVAAPGEVDVLLARGRMLSNGWFLLVGQNEDRFGDFQDQIVRIAGWSLAGVFVLAVLGGRAISASMLRRVAAITDASSEIMRGNLGRRIALRGTGDEFDHLSANLNEMLDRIQMLMDGLKQVSNDIAHDLRTPLSHLRQRLEDARDKATSAAEYRGAVETAIGATDEILATFGALLRIAQIESGTRRAAFAPVDLSAVARMIAETYGPVAEDRGQHLTSRIAEGVTVNGDRQLLTQLLANLVENAVRHSPAKTTISLALDDRPDGALMSVRDDGPGIPADERRKVFRRFYRLDTSRTTPGSGLGLSLVAAIADLHRIAVELANAEPGLLVTLRFPRMGPP